LQDNDSGFNKLNNESKDKEKLGKSDNN